MRYRSIAMPRLLRRYSWTIATLVGALVLFASGPPTSVNAQLASEYKLALHANLPASDVRAPLDPFAVRAGTEIVYRVDATVPAGVTGIEYYFETPPGTLFISAEVREGARISTELQPWASGNPRGQGDVRVVAKPLAPFGSFTVTVRVNAVYQGPVSAVARFRGKPAGGAGAGASNPVVFQFDHGDGVPGQLVVDAFVDMNGNGLVESDDVRQSCGVYVYQDLSRTVLPDDLPEPTDARLPLASVGETSFDQPALINLFPGRYSVSLGSCDTPLPPSGIPETTFEVRYQPPPTAVPNKAATAAYDVQTVDILGNQIARIVTASQPVGPTATPTDLRFDASGILRWTDRADGETAYRVEISGAASGTFELPAGSTQFVIPADLLPCGTNNVDVVISAMVDGAAGYPARAVSPVDGACVRPITAPQTGMGPQRRGDWSDLIVASLSLGIWFGAAGILTTRKNARVQAP
jgi:hypothetical protein